MVADTLNDPKRTKNMVGASYQMMTDTFKIADENAAIDVESSSVAATKKNQDEGIINIGRDSAGSPGTEKKKSSPSNESSNDRSDRAGDDKEEENVEEDKDWSKNTPGHCETPRP